MQALHCKTLIFTVIFLDPGDCNIYVHHYSFLKLWISSSHYLIATNNLDHTYCPVVVSGEKESAEETMRDNDGVLTTAPFRFVSIEGLKKSWNSIIDICTTEQEREWEEKGERERKENEWGGERRE